MPTKPLSNEILNVLRLLEFEIKNLKWIIFNLKKINYISINNDISRLYD